MEKGWKLQQFAYRHRKMLLKACEGPFEDFLSLSHLDGSENVGSAGFLYGLSNYHWASPEESP
jgi:hypothetical protein